MIEPKLSHIELAKLVQFVKDQPGQKQATIGEMLGWKKPKPRGNAGPPF